MPSGPSLLAIEALFTVLCILAALLFARPQHSRPSVPFQIFSYVARRRTLSVTVVGFGAFAARLAILPFCPIPIPFIQDDFSFLLAADTFASGRLTNAPHLMWPHFESFHITVFPTYMSMYFPAQGLVMAAGRVLAGHPWFGVLFSTAAMAAAICWMLQAWLPNRWALLGGLLVILRLGLFSYWIDTYVGGSVAAVGGALVVGALPRIWTKLRARDFLLLAFGLAILANSRPYEGLLLTIPALTVLSHEIYKRRRPSPRFLLRRASASLVLLLLTVSWMAYYNYRVFGSVFTLPYTLNRHTYASAPHFLWQKPRPEPAYRHAVMRDFYSNFELSEFLKARSVPGFLLATTVKLVTVELFFFGFIMLLPIAALPRVLRDKRTRPLLFIAGFFAVGLAIETWLIPHYVAPLTAVIYAVFLQCLRHMRTWRFDGRRIGIVLARAVPATCCILCVIRLYAAPLHLGLAPQRFSSRAWFGTYPFGLERAHLLSNLERLPGKQLVLVRYSARHDSLKEWVYNAADIDASRVVWAREMNASEDAKLLAYFSDRRAWLVEPDCTPVRVTPLSAPAAQNDTFRKDSLYRARSGPDHVR